MNPFFDDTTTPGEYYSSSIYLDDFASNINLTNTKDFYIFPVTNLLNNLEDSYEAFKFNTYLFNNNYGNVLNDNSAPINFHTYSYVFDFFRSNTEDLA